MKKVEKEASSDSKNKWKKTHYQGVYYRLSEGERVDGNGNPDKCFFIRYKKEGRGLWEKVGWGGDGYSAETAKGIRGERVRSIWHGEELPKEKAKIPRFSEMWKLYQKWAEENKARAGRDDSYLYKNHLQRPLGNKRLNEITSFDLERLKSNLVKKELSPGSVKHCLVLVREIINKAISWGKFRGDNPVRQVKLPSLNNRRERFLTHEEAGKLLAEVKKTSEAVHDMTLISLHCGLRAGEIFNLRGQDLDFQNGIINIADPKNKTSRKAYMTPEVKEVLKSRFPETQEELVFPDNRNGGVITQISKTYREAADKLFNKGTKDPKQRVCFHTLRHSYGSWLAMEGVPLITIKELMGHKSLAMTERYSHLIPDIKRQASLDMAEKFRQSLAKQEEKEEQAAIA